jgi:preprotein translocase subunit YajC
MNLKLLSAILAQATAPAAGAAGTQTTQNPTAQMLQTVLMFGGIFVVFYLLMIRPQSKKAKELAAKLGSLKPGDKIITSSGIVGTVVAIKDRTISLRSAETKLEVLKSAVSDITERAGETSTAE